MLEKSINEEAGLPYNWHPIDAAPIIPGGAPPFPNAMGNYQSPAGRRNNEGYYRRKSGTSDR